MRMTSVAAAALAVTGLTTLAPGAHAASTTLLVNEVYGGGGNSGATLTHDFVELLNVSTEAVRVDGWTVKYYSAGGNLVIGLLQLIRDVILPAPIPGFEHLKNEDLSRGEGWKLPMPAGAILVSPWCDLTHSFPSTVENTATVCISPLFCAICI